MIVDSRLAGAADLQVGSKVHSAGHEFAVVGIVPAGALARIFIPRSTAEYLFNGRLDRHTLQFVKLRDGVRIGAVAERIRTEHRLAAIGMNEYRGMLVGQWQLMYVFVDMVNVVVLSVAFLFILVVLFIMVLQRRREIAILLSMGATRWFILSEVVAESMLLTVVGTTGGVAMSFGAAAAIEAVRPLLTVTVTLKWIAVAGGASLLGGTIAALGPGWQAANVNVAEAINLE